MAKQGMKKDNEHNTRKKKQNPTVPMLQGKEKSGKKKAGPVSRP